MNSRTQTITQGYMIIAHALANGDYVEIEGKNARYWDVSGVQTYTGPIDNLPKSVIQELTTAGVIKKRSK
jgi:hypothetical protein